MENDISITASDRKRVVIPFGLIELEIQDINGEVQSSIGTTGRQLEIMISQWFVKGAASMYFENETR